MDSVAVDEKRDMAWLEARCADLTAKNEALWLERMAVINGLGLEKALDAGDRFERAVLAAAGASADFARGFNAARTRAAALVRDNQASDPIDHAVAISAMRADEA